MIRISCVNANCTAPDGVFSWDEGASVEGGGDLAEPGEEGAVSFVAECPYCGTENKIWLSRVKKENVVRRFG
jgi:hypothetical protein